MSQNRYAAGRTIQLLGLIILPLAIAAELSGQVGLGASMLISAVGAICFFAGVSIQGRT